MPNYTANLDGGVLRAIIGNDHTSCALNSSNPRDDACGRHILAIIYAVSSQRR